MEKRDRLSIIIVLFLFSTLLEWGIILEAVFHNISPGLGSPFKYNERGIIGIYFLTLFIPVTAIIIFIIRLTSCIKKCSNIKELSFDCICALIGIGIGIGIIYLSPDNPISGMGAMITSFIIDYFYWMSEKT